MHFTRMISTPPMRNDQIIRYSGVRQTDPESLSIHLVDVQMMGYAMIRTMNKDHGESINIGLYLEKALIHDLDEVLTGDMPRSTKYYNDTILQEMKAVADDAMYQVSRNFFNDEEVFKIWSESKSGKEGIVVKLVDMLCVASKVMKEVELLNNNYFLKVAYEVRPYLLELVKYLNKKSPFTESATEYLINLLQEAHDEVDGIWESRQHIAQSYGILENIFQGKGDK
jgi:5'-deoxynucleotidase YfbR-like HD superfamily hydrolase